MRRRITLIVGCLLAGQALAGSYLFGAVKEFCEAKFEGEIALKGEPYNATDVINADLYSRRIVEEYVTSDVGYIWYEHGGRGYHQHLVRFNVFAPEEVLENYTFFKSEHKSIFSLIKYKHLLIVNKQGEL